MKDIRKKFPFLEREEGLIYFDSAASTQKPYQVVQAMYDFYCYSYGTVHRALYDLGRKATDLYEGVRDSVQQLIHAEHREEIVFTRGTTAALNLVARSFATTLAPKTTLLITEVEHHSNIVPWQLVAKERDLRLDFIPVNEKGEIIFEAFMQKLRNNVGLVSLAHISNVLGTIHPIKDIIREAHKVGAKVCVDGAQAAGHCVLNLQEMNADFYAFSSHKMYGPTGVGVLYGKKALLETMTPWEGGGDMIEHVSLQESRFAPPPLRFEAGTPMIAEVIGLGEAVTFLQECGLETIGALEKKLTDYAYQKLQAMPEVVIVGQPRERGALISFYVQGVHSLDVATLLDCRKIALRSGHHCSQPTMERFGVTSLLRISFALYNTMEEIDRFIHDLQEVIRILRV